ncbi:hypothetical protein P3X46_003057 [Hevea brasiliensis]|uniref:Uncharacterized protein n=1 Tax=Hevea brasiliensis TaxID=3981 RepID=A0ABQ9N8E2_HEVBR|nr:hypothetical protein P3X46_003057 [Hevea brasiliensis]
MQVHEAIRVPFPHTEGVLVGEKVVGLLESLVTPVTPSGPSGCTHVPTPGGPCVNNEMNYAGRRAMAPPPPYPHPMAPVGMSANRK